LLDATAEDLGKLEQERLDLEVRYAETRHRVLEQALHRLMQARLLETEAAHRQMSVQQLLTQELAGKVKPVTQEQLDTFYQLNRALIGKPEAEAADELRTRLAQNNLSDARMRFVDQLRRKYAAENLLGPLRLPVGTVGPSRGNQKAPVTLVEFADFECPYCAALAPLLRQAVASWPDQIRVVFREYPLEETHSHAWLASEAALCAGEQHRFWEMHDALFADRTHLEKDQLTAKARGVGLDMSAFDQCLGSDRYTGQINADIREGNALGVKGTPSLFINGHPAGGLTSLAELRAAIDAELGNHPQQLVTSIDAGGGSGYKDITPEPTGRATQRTSTGRDE